MHESKIKILLVNTGIFFICLLIIEIIFGYWFSKDNLGPYMREHRMKKNPTVLVYENDTFNFVYKRNYYGFRGEEIDPSEIKAVILGGSTTDERYKPEEFTITENLNFLLKKKGYDFKIINAGLQGQSSYGHIYNFQHWFSRLKNFSPELYIFYIGINDQWTEPDRPENDWNGLGLGFVKSPVALDAFFDNIKSRSFFADKLRILKQKYYLTSKKIKHDHDYFYGEDGTKNKIINDYEYINYEKALEIHDIEYLKSKHQKRISNYLNNIKILNNYARSNGAVPVFVTQVRYDGLKVGNIFILNYSLIEYCKKRNLNCIDLGKKLNGKLEYWYDIVHTTKLGSKIVAETIINDLAKIIKNENLF